MTNTQHLFTLVKFYIGIDDALDLAAEHAIGGVVGLLANVCLL